MTFQLGRITGLNDPYNWDGTDDEGVVVTGSYLSTGLSDGLVKRDQLLSLVNDDEPAIPVILSGEPRVNGYYRPQRVQILTDQFSRQKGNLYDYQIQLSRVAGFAQPYVEAIVNGALLTNAVGAVLTDVIGFHAYPSAALEYSPSAGGTLTARASADGSVNFLRSPSSLSFSAKFGLATADYYTGAGKFEQGSPLQVVVGRRLVQSDLVNWRLSNGMVRITPNAVNANKLDFSWWKGAAWSAVKTFVISQAGVNLPVWSSLVVLRNSPEEAIIRLASTLTGGQYGSTVLDIGLRRGDMVARMYLNSTQSAGWRIARDTAEAATAVAFGAITGGAIRATANDADSLRYMLASMQAATTQDLANGRLTLNPSGTTMDIGVGAETGAPRGVPDDATSLAQEYIAAQSELLRVVNR